MEFDDDTANFEEDAHQLITDTITYLETQDINNDKGKEKLKRLREMSSADITTEQAETLIRAHEHRSDEGAVGEFDDTTGMRTSTYSDQVKFEKARHLLEGGWSRKDAEVLLDLGVAGLIY